MPEDLTFSLENFGTFEEEAVEIVSFGEFPPQEVIIRFLIGDGNPERTHRNHLFNPKFQTIGVAVGTHNSQYKRMTCINFTHAFTEK